MLTKRIIPCLDVAGGRVVKGTSFTHLRDAGDPIELASFYYNEGADELVFLDIGATPEERDTMADVVEHVARQVFIPLTVGGGLRSLKDMRLMLEAGADKVSVNTAAVNNPQLLSDGASRFGSQCIVLAIDAMRNRVGEDTKWLVCTHGGRKQTALDAVEWAKTAVRMGTGEILLTSWDSDGRRAGYDLELTSTISRTVSVPVIASGGAGNLEHLYDAIMVGKADAVLAASIFHYGNFTIREAKQYLQDRGIPIRM